jgi:hypothetical protein
MKRHIALGEALRAEWLLEAAGWIFLCQEAGLFSSQRGVVKNRKRYVTFEKMVRVL